jgi:hypothetical protein
MELDTFQKVVIFFLVILTIGVVAAITVATLAYRKDLKLGTKFSESGIRMQGDINMNGSDITDVSKISNSKGNLYAIQSGTGIAGNLPSYQDANTLTDSGIVVTNHDLSNVGTLTATTMNGTNVNATTFNNSVLSSFFAQANASVSFALTTTLTEVDTATFTTTSTSTEWLISSATGEFQYIGNEDRNVLIIYPIDIVMPAAGSNVSLQVQKKVGTAISPPFIRKFQSPTGVSGTGQTQMTIFCPTIVSKGDVFALYALGSGSFSLSFSNQLFSVVNLL